MVLCPSRAEASFPAVAAGLVARRAALLLQRAYAMHLFDASSSQVRVALQADRARLLHSLR
eukprot:4877660-Lingulodinium_polyedra.AAC.1